ncbi:MAG: molybdopterin dehydrogenase [Herbaspirillum sp.]|jgi:carbon-monoxide dehydrogenase medium subunit|nr:molybdopterin dehydrogenase [Herbaspirillum sp.]
MKPPQFEYARPATLEQAVALLQAHDGDAKAIAGGQSLMPMLAFRMAAPSLLVDIGRLPDLAHIRIQADGVRLGALVRWCDIERNLALAAAHPLLCAAIAHVAHYQIRNRGTVGGSLAHADPAAEMPGIAVACDAHITVVGSAGQRRIAAADFFTGTLSTQLAADELIVDIHLPPWKPDRRWAFEEFSRRKGDFALAGIAVFFDMDDDGCALAPHIGVIGVADLPRRLHAAEAMLDGKKIDAALIASVAAAIGAAVDPPDDMHGSAAYRRALLGTLAERALARAAGIALTEPA